MCIYCGTDKYRKIYEYHYGKIPKDKDGRTYHIHHIDGNHDNNNPLNLKAVTIQEHYDIHNSQGDFGACLLISGEMNICPEEKSNLASLHNKKMISDGTHHFLDGEYQRSIQQRRIKNGTHHFQKRSDGTSLRSDIMNSSNFVNPFSKIGKDHFRYDHTVYQLRHKITGEIINSTQEDLVKIHGLDGGNVSNLVRRKSKSCKGWVLVTN
jgi:hypothetical protein